MSILSQSDQSHGLIMEEFVRWCDKSKTRELIVSPKHTHGLPAVIHGGSVEVFQTYKYLGTVFDDRLEI